MPSMIELIRVSAIPANILQSASKGALAIPAPEMIEILVHLALHNSVFGEQARLTLAGWDEKSSRSMASDPQAPKEVLEYMSSPQNLRLVLLPALIENLSVSDAALDALAAEASRKAAEIMLKSARVMQSTAILTALNGNSNLSGIQAETVKAKLAPPGEVLPEESDPEAGPDEVLDAELIAYLAEHAREIADEEGKPFQPIGGLYEDILGMDEPEAAAASAHGGTKPATRKKTGLIPDVNRGSSLQKISKLDVKGRIQLAMKGTKEERSILVRDGTKVVALAVLDSPKITDSEVEHIAGQKNVLEALLRGIPLKRRFMKHYPIVRNLVSNPRTPLDVSLTLMKNLLPNDLKNLSANKDVSDTVRKLALKMFKQKKDPGKS